MKRNIYKYVGIAAVAAVMLFTANTAQAAGGFQIVKDFFKKVGSSIVFRDTSWQLGSSSERISKIWVTDLDCSGTCPSGGSGSPGGSNTQVQFNDGGSFNGDAGLTYNKTSDLLTTTNLGVGSASSFDGTLKLFNSSSDAEYDIWNSDDTNIPYDALKMQRAYSTSTVSGGDPYATLITVKAPENSTTISSVDTTAETVTTPTHNFQTGAGVRVQNSGGGVPGGITANTIYYVRATSATTLSFHPTRTDAVNNTNALNLSSSGSGTNTISLATQESTITLQRVSGTANEFIDLTANSYEGSEYFTFRVQKRGTGATLKPLKVQNYDGTTLNTLANFDNINNRIEFGGPTTPITTDGAALGTSSLMWSDLFLASGGVLNWNNGAVTLTQSGGVLTMVGSTFGLDSSGTSNIFNDRGATSNFGLNVFKTAGTDQWSFGLRNDSTNKLYITDAVNGGHIITATQGATPSVLAGGNWTFSSTITPSANDGAALGTSSIMWSDLFLASGSVINLNNGDVTLTHSADTLTMAGGTLVLPSSGLQVGASNPFSDSAGTLTLQNVDAVDATTETTVEAAIDTLANLTSIQGFTLTLTGDLIRSGAHSLTLTTSGTTNATFPSGTFTLAGTNLTTQTFTGTNIFNPTLTIASGASATNNGFSIPASTTTLTGSTNITTATGFNQVNIGAPTYSAASSLAITNAATVYIADAPTGAGAGPASITNPYALWIDAGTVRVDGTALFGSTITPQANDGAALGSTSLSFSDVFLATGAVLNFANGNFTVTHSSGLLTFSGGITATAGTVTLGTIAGTIDAGGATGFEIPNGTGPTVSNTGQVAVDTTDDQVRYQGASTTRNLTWKYQKGIVIESPASGDNFVWWKTPDAITIRSIDCIVDPADSSESVVITVNELDGSGDNAAGVDGATTITCSNTGAADDGSLSNPGIDAGDWIGIDPGTVTGTVTALTVTINYSLDSE